MDDDDYGYGSRGMGLLRILSFTQDLLIPLAIVMVVTPIVLYMVARSRANREPFPDSQLGVKFALAYFKTNAFHMMLAGTVMLLFSLLMKSSDKSPVYRTAFGVIIPASLVYIAHVVALAKTNQHEFPTVGRLFAGWSLLISGVLGFGALMFVSQTMAQKDSAGEMGRFGWALFLVYGSAWTVQAVRFFRHSTGVQVPLDLAYPPPPGAYPPPPGVTVPAYAVPASPFAPPPPVGAAAYAPPAPSPFAPGASGSSGPTAPPGPSPFPPGSPFAPVAGVPAPTPTPGPSPFAPPAAGSSGPVASPFAPPAPAVPLPGPMAQPLAPPGSAPTGSKPGGEKP